MTSIWNTSREVVVYFIWIGKNSPDVLAQYLPLMFPIDGHCVKSVQIWSYFWSVFGLFSRSGSLLTLLCKYFFVLDNKRKKCLIKILNNLPLIGNFLSTRKSLSFLKDRIHFTFKYSLEAALQRCF